MTKNRKFFDALILAFGLIFLTSVAAYAKWSPPPSPPNQTSVSGLINAGSLSQTKKGGLQVNGQCDAGCPVTQGNTQIGLIIDGDSSKNKGRVGIGTASPGEQLDLAGNMIVNGYLYLQAGAVSEFPDIGEVLSWTEPQGQTPSVTWSKDLGWMTIQRIDIFDGAGRGCVQVFPDCPQGWREYSVVQSGDACSASASSPFVIMNDYRNCYQNFVVQQAQQSS